ncbi:MAG: hypothetical protein CVU79_01095 [Elusimicrobia bacterium HGW-Elusimicrobia-3]|jgi:DNA-binding transcriptional regulator YiaG|nr:MAG: hypothetical protein CVU79_01095 [Elusimicrobia bacterium HGW-Elusimicrobia-3]
MITERLRERILYAMRQRGLGVSADAVCRKMGITRQTLRNWEERTKDISDPESARSLIHIQANNATPD